MSYCIIILYYIILIISYSIYIYVCMVFRWMFPWSNSRKIVRCCKIWWVRQLAVLQQVPEIQAKMITVMSRHPKFWCSLLHHKSFNVDGIDCGWNSFWGQPTLAYGCFLKLGYIKWFPHADQQQSPFITLFLCEVPISDQPGSGPAPLAVKKTHPRRYPELHGGMKSLATSKHGIHCIQATPGVYLARCDWWTQRLQETRKHSCYYPWLRF